MHSESQVREMTWVFFFHLLDHFTGCSLRELWNLSAAGVTLLPNVSSLGDAAAQYPSCNVGSVGSVVLRDNRLNTATVAYYSGTTPGSRACFVCDESSGHGLNTTITERVCQNDAAWSGSPIICGTLCYMVIYKIVHVYVGEMNIWSLNTISPHATTGKTMVFSKIILQHAQQVFGH